MVKTKNKMGVQESLDFIIKHMATKEDVRDIVHEELKDIRAELKEIRKRLEVLEERAENHAGFSKEVDHVLQRVIAIEKHLGIKTKSFS